MMKHEINYKIRQLKVQENCVIMISTQEEKIGMMGTDAASTQKTEVFPGTMIQPYLGTAWGTLSVRSRQCSLEKQ